MPEDRVLQFSHPIGINVLVATTHGHNIYLYHIITNHFRWIDEHALQAADTRPTCVQILTYRPKPRRCIRDRFAVRLL